MVCGVSMKWTLCLLGFVCVVMVISGCAGVPERWADECRFFDVRAPLVWEREEPFEPSHDDVFQVSIVLLEEHDECALKTSRATMLMGLDGTVEHLEEEDHWQPLQTHARAWLSEQEDGSIRLIARGGVKLDGEAKHVFYIDEEVTHNGLVAHEIVALGDGVFKYILFRVRSVPMHWKPA